MREEETKLSKRIVPSALSSQLLTRSSNNFCCERYERERIVVFEASDVEKNSFRFFPAIFDRIRFYIERIKYIAERTKVDRSSLPSLAMFAIVPKTRI